MSDNTQLNSGTGGDLIATDDIGGGVKIQRVKVTQGADGTATDVSSAAPLQVTLANTGANTTAVKVDNSAVTQPVSATALPLPSGAATESTLDTRTGALTETAPATDTASSGINGRLQRLAQRLTTLLAVFPTTIDTNSGNKSASTLRVVLATDQPQTTAALKVDGSAVTQPVSAASLPLPSGAATESTLDTRTGALTETAPASDTASSGMNGRLQRIAQRLSSLIALLPTALGANGGLKIEGVASGTVVPVSLASVPSHAVTNAGTFAVQESGTQVVADDAAFTPGTTKVVMAGYQADESSTDSVDEGDGGAARMTLDRKLIVTLQPHTAGGWDTKNCTSGDGSTALTNTAQAIKASAGKLGGWFIYNPNAVVAYVPIYNVAQGSVTVGTTNPLMVIGIPAGSAANVEFANGITFDTAIAAAACTTAGGAVALSSAIDANFFYK